MIENIAIITGIIIGTGLAWFALFALLTNFAKYQARKAIKDLDKLIAKSQKRRQAFRTHQAIMENGHNEDRTQKKMTREG